MKKGLAVLLSVFIFASCMQVKDSIKADRMINNIPVEKTVVIVLEKYRIYHSVLPSGEYLPVAGNDNGVYYLSPQKIEASGGPYDGGVFIYYKNSSVTYYWVTVWGATHIYDELYDLKFELHCR